MNFSSLVQVFYEKNLARCSVGSSSRVTDKLLAYFGLKILENFTDIWCTKNIHTCCLFVFLGFWFYVKWNFRIADDSRRDLPREWLLHVWRSVLIKCLNFFFLINWFSLEGKYLHKNVICRWIGKKNPSFGHFRIFEPLSKDFLLSIKRSLNSKTNL